MIGRFGHRNAQPGNIMFGAAPGHSVFLGGLASPTATTHFWQSGKTLNASISPAGAISKGMVLSTATFAAGLGFSGAVSKGMVLGINTFAAGLSFTGGIIEQPFHTYVAMSLLAFKRKFSFVTSTRMWKTLSGPRKFTLTVLDSGRASLLTNPPRFDMSTTEVLSLTMDMTSALVAGETPVVSPVPVLTLTDLGSNQVVYTYNTITPSGVNLPIVIDGSKLAPNHEYQMKITCSTSTAKKVTVLTTVRTVS